MINLAAQVSIFKAIVSSIRNFFSDLIFISISLSSPPVQFCVFRPIIISYS
jgi:hypothetical protein